MTSSARRFLVRDRTSSSHAKVEATVGSFDSLENYRRYLRGSYIFRASLDARMNGLHWPEQFGLWAASDRLTDLMRQDMDDLGVTPPPINLAQPEPLLASDFESLLGTLYVVEGSSLGARVLFRRAQTLGLSDTFGARHLAAQARSVERWKRLLELLESAPVLDLDRTVAASEATFVAVERAFEGGDHA
ncbi:heme oxygenase [Pseudorhizobium tarimense]|uniref:Heme oxygenase n=1 Tax=Pseudorhizobium tarimense TaxID=1079109 RepID=A0ABV2HCE5_9HYPH|nr:biliverdin-producing heme oxygenase [Pseudorhizobium tarimense]MCJ8521263.1 biliverdin-producing heme oxygenase [Pseudorhizobium tarimense]